MVGNRTYRLQGIALHVFGRPNPSNRKSPARDNGVVSKKIVKTLKRFLGNLAFRDHGKQVKEN